MQDINSRNGRKSDRNRPIRLGALTSHSYLFYAERLDYRDLATMGNARNVAGAYPFSCLCAQFKRFSRVCAQAPPPATVID